MKIRSLLAAALCLLAVFAAAPRAHAQQGPIQVLTFSSAGAFTQTPLTLSAGQVMTVDSNGNPIALTPAVYAPMPRTGSVTMTVAGGLTKVVTFTNAMPSANYSIAFGASGLGSVVTSWSNKTAAGFTINLSVASAGTLDYTCTQQASATQ